jgi:TRAP-type C4-dicarboxylate transport system permease small subunit
MWSKIKRIFDDIEEWFLVISIALNVLLVFYQVVMRYVFRNSISWSEELARYMFLWYSWVGTSYAVRKAGHLRVEMLANAFKGKNRDRFEILVLSIWLGFSLFLTYEGALMTRFVMERGQTSAALEIPMAFAYASVPVGCGLMALRLVGSLRESFRNLRREGGRA